MSIAWPTGVQLLVFFCSSVSVVLFDTPGISRCRLQHISVESSSLFHHSIYLGLKPLLHQGLSEPEFYGDLVYKFKKNEGRADFSDQFRKIIVRFCFIVVFICDLFVPCDDPLMS